MYPIYECIHVTTSVCIAQHIVYQKEYYYGYAQLEILHVICCKKIRGILYCGPISEGPLLYNNCISWTRRHVFTLIGLSTDLFVQDSSNNTLILTQ